MRPEPLSAVMPGASLSAHRLHVRLGPRDVLHDFSVELHAATWTAVVGPNGAGKSTLLRALAGLVPCQHGHVELQGRRLHAWAAPARARQIAWLAQSATGPDELTVAEVVALGRFPHQGWLGRDGDADRQAVAAAMQMARCEPLAHRRLATLSGGERQRAMLARALAVQAPILLMDEPTTFLDPPHQAELARTLMQLAQLERKTVVSVVHDMSLALWAQRMIVIRDGRLVGAGPVEQAVREQWLQQAFGMDMHFVEHQGRYLWQPHL